MGDFTGITFMKELYVLGHCDALYGTRGSTSSELAAARIKALEKAPVLVQPQRRGAKLRSQ